MESRKMVFRHCVIEGSPYEAGQQLGRFLKRDQALIKKLTTPFMGGNRLTYGQFQKTREQYDRFCPGINEEICGFADAVGAKAEDMTLYYAYLQLNQGNCSQIALTPSVSDDGNCYLVRNYDFGLSEEPILIESSIQGQYRQIGFGCQVFGRFDGMNEEGLCVTTSAGAIHPNYSEDGFVFPVVVRALLNECKTVQEAVSLFQKIKFADFRNIMVIDKKGNAALIEAAASTHEIILAGSDAKEEYLFATNHYNSETISKMKLYTPRHSMIRYEFLKEWFRDAASKRGFNDLKKILSDPMPYGLGCHYYGNGMGTIWSIIFNATKAEADICFGTPSINQWRKFQFTSSNQIETFTAELLDEEAPDGFWDHLSRS